VNIVILLAQIKQPGTEVLAKLWVEPRFCFDFAKSQKKDGVRPSGARLTNVQPNREASRDGV
jgi:hypothetical protein